MATRIDYFNDPAAPAANSVVHRQMSSSKMRKAASS